MNSLLFQRWLKSMAALSMGGLMIAAPAFGQGKSDPPKSPAAEAAKDKDRPNTPAPPAPGSDSKAKSDDKAPSNPTPPSGTTPSSSAGAGNSAGNSGSDKETPRRPDAPPATPATPGNPNAKDNQPAKDSQPSKDTLPGMNRDKEKADPNRTPDANRDSTAPNRNDRDATRDPNTDRDRPQADPNTARDSDRRDADRRDSDRRDGDRRDGDRRDNVNVSTKVKNQAFSTLGLQVNVATRGNGLTISTVQPNSIFYSAGFRTNDVIMRVGDRRFTDDVIFYNWLATVRPNQRIAIIVLRDGREETVYWTPTEQWIEEYTTITKEVAVPGNSNALGIYLDPQVQDAAVVAEVEPNSAADKAGVQRNDVVEAVNGERVRSPRDFQALTANVQVANTELTLSRQMKVQLGGGDRTSTTTTTVERRNTLVSPAPSAVPTPPQPAATPAVNPTRPATAVPATPPRGEGRPGILPRNR